MSLRHVYIDSAYYFLIRIICSTVEVVKNNEEIQSWNIEMSSQNPIFA